VLNEHMDPAGSFHYLNQVGPLTNVHRNVQPLDATPYTPGTWAQLYATPKKI